MKQTSILCLTYGPLYRLTKEAAVHLAEEQIRISVLDGLSETMVEEIRQRIFDGVDCIVAGGSNADFCKRQFDIPVVEIRISAYDYLQAIHRARKLGKSIAVVVLEENGHQDFQTIERLSGVKLTVVSYSTGDDLDQAIARCGADVIIGAGHAVEIGRRMGKETVLIYPGVETVKTAILEANKLVKEMWRERSRSQLTDALIRYTPNSIVITDEAGRIAAFNSGAERAYGVQAHSVKGLPVGQALADCTLDQVQSSGIDRENSIQTVGGKMYLQKQICIRHDDQVTGAIEILEELSQIRYAEHKYNVEQEQKNKRKQFSARTQFDHIVGSSRILQETIAEAKLFSQSEASILLMGETGTGKELFAQSIHNHSHRKRGPFVAINCAALPESLLESELFGYEEGAFTGSKRGGKMGIFELADGGTIFLDEIGEVSLPLQARLLRALQEKEVMRIGGERMYPFDARVIAATNRYAILEDEQLFRRDLLYRLKVLELHLPPLRERGDDAVELFYSFLRRHGSLMGTDAALDETAATLLRRYSWPGNVRELENVCERFCLYAGQMPRQDGTAVRRNLVRAIGRERLLQDILTQHGFAPGKPPLCGEAMRTLAADLQNCLGYNKGQVAEILGVSRTTLWRMEK